MVTCMEVWCFLVLGRTPIGWSPCWVGEVDEVMQMVYYNMGECYAKCRMQWCIRLDPLQHVSGGSELGLVKIE